MGRDEMASLASLGPAWAMRGSACLLLPRSHSRDRAPRGGRAPWAPRPQISFEPASDVQGSGHMGPTVHLTPERRLDPRDHSARVQLLAGLSERRQQVEPLGRRIEGGLRVPLPGFGESDELEALSEDAECASASCEVDRSLQDLDGLGDIARAEQSLPGEAKPLGIVRIDNLGLPAARLPVARRTSPREPWTSAYRRVTSSSRRPPFGQGSFPCRPGERLDPSRIDVEGRVDRLGQHQGRALGVEHPRPLGSASQDLHRVAALAETDGGAPERVRDLGCLEPRPSCKSAGLLRQRHGRLDPAGLLGSPRSFQEPPGAVVVANAQPGRLLEGTSGCTRALGRCFGGRQLERAGGDLVRADRGERPVPRPAFFRGAIDECSARARWASRRAAGVAPAYATARTSGWRNSSRWPSTRTTSAASAGSSAPASMPSTAHA